MANTIAKAVGRDRTRDKHTHRVGSVSASVQAATWRTFANATVYKDGDGYIEVYRDGVQLHRFDFGPES